MKKFRLLTLLILLLAVTFPLTVSAFSDVKNYEEEIDYLTSKGIIKGYEGNIFKPESPILRLQAVQMILREKGITDFSAPNPNFTDIEPGDYGYDEIAKAVDMGFINGKTNPNTGEKYFDPYGSLTREQMAKVLVLAYNLEGEYDKQFSDVKTSNWSYEFVSTLAANNITTGYQNGTFKPSQSLSRQHFAVFMARLLDDKFKVIEKVLTTSEIVALNDSKVVMIEMNNSQGSGVIVGDGLILTNHHVIDGAYSGKVYLSDGSVYAIDGIVAQNSTKDLALIKTKTPIVNSSPVDIGTDSSLKVGDKVVAIGSPLGLMNTVSEGIVSSFRVMSGVDHIQISAEIDHGSSGGGLFNSKGELVGITTSGYLGGNANLNFAVGIDEAKGWNKYFTMDFAKIKSEPFVSPSTGTTLPIDGFTDIALGMTKEQVKGLENAPLLYEDTTILRYVDKQVMGLTGEVVYEFENNKLVAINVYHYIVDNQADLDILEGYFVVLHNDLSAIYGSPQLVDPDWSDDEDGYTLSAYWTLKQHNLLLIVQVDPNFSSNGGMRISIQ